MISVEVFDKIDRVYDIWYFKLNLEGYIEIIIENRVMDTIYSFGEDICQLQVCVKSLLDHWNMEYKNLNELILI